MHGRSTEEWASRLKRHGGICGGMDKFEHSAERAVYTPFRAPPPSIVDLYSARPRTTATCRGMASTPDKNEFRAETRPATRGPMTWGRTLPSPTAGMWGQKPAVLRDARGKTWGDVRSGPGELGFGSSSGMLEDGSAVDAIDQLARPGFHHHSCVDLLSKRRDFIPGACTSLVMVRFKCGCC